MYSTVQANCDLSGSYCRVKLYAEEAFRQLTASRLA